MLDVGDVVQRMEVGGPFVRFAVYAHEFDHESTLVVGRRAHGGFAAGGGFLGIDRAGEMGGGALRIAKLEAAGFDPKPFANELFEVLGSAREHGMTERIK